ncbi:proline-rich protein HaeIII subfamily 1 [Rhinolophus ferrumequinum]|uniref:proline-rich protein HaeIII subfamily 1 n=1 Tax=Rhinolophus ferrumequinum TaxID=59479 RepID=UPI00140FFC89|nr:proline-rich protein HaeIII subfamily 1 [Rhinolophus ferrumequinum]XP_032960571.1 proline-rich protein HaeIII subfamily 1 [Rhinolophus ferrumequinum]
MKEAAASLPLSLSCAGGGGRGGGGDRQREGRRGRLGRKTITTIKKVIASSLAPSGQSARGSGPGAGGRTREDQADSAVQAKVKRPRQVSPFRLRRAVFATPPLFISVDAADAAAFYFLFFVSSFSFPLLPSPRVSHPSLPFLPLAPSRASRSHRPLNGGSRLSRPPGAAIGCCGPVNRAPPPRGPSTPPLPRPRSSQPLLRRRIVAAGPACKLPALPPRARPCGSSSRPAAELPRARRQAGPRGYSALSRAGRGRHPTLAPFSRGHRHLADPSLSRRAPKAGTPSRSRMWLVSSRGAGGPARRYTTGPGPRGERAASRDRFARSLSLSYPLSKLALWS